MQTQPKPGMACPQCGFFIDITIEDLLYKGSIICPGCTLELTMNRDSSRESLQALQDLHTAIKNVEALKKQSL